ncbi:hypothetical protein, partial [Xanthomonas vasicola]|uniref:hypothetical protein n=1 Tax=Xanthomonas vasicola TaxID=56459 RepID=UPI001FEE0F1C
LALTGRGFRLFEAFTYATTKTLTQADMTLHIEASRNARRILCALHRHSNKACIILPDTVDPSNAHNA